MHGSYGSNQYLTGFAYTLQKDLTFYGLMIVEERSLIFPAEDKFVGPIRQ